MSINGLKNFIPFNSRIQDKTITKRSDAAFSRTALLPEIMEKFFNADQQGGAKGTIQLKGDEIYKPAT